MDVAQYVINKFGGQAALARLIGKRPSTVQHWAASGVIPAKWHTLLLSLAREHGMDLSASDFVQPPTLQVARGSHPHPSPLRQGRGDKTGNAKGAINVAVVGVGNCASSLVQGVHYYQDARPGDRVPGLMHVDLGGYHVRDINFVAAFDIDQNKVGKDLADAIFTEPNKIGRAHV